MSAWIGVDLDGTLAEYDTWQGPLHIGKPVPRMVARVRNWLKAGQEVRIFTARANKEHPEYDAAILAIKAWCMKVFGVELPVTAAKDYSMIELWDDRCRQVYMNTGVPVSDTIDRLVESLRNVERAVDSGLRGRPL